MEQAHPKPDRPAGLSFDAFISYSHSDLKIAQKVQLFLESYRYASDKRYVKVFLDKTDIRGGELHAEIRSAIVGSQTLIVCLSQAAAESVWVAKEVEFFKEAHGSARIALVFVAGKQVPQLPVLADVDCRRHDIRAGQRWGMWSSGARLELLRLLAFVTGVELRTLRNWHLRRRLRNGLIASALASVPPVAIALYPVDDWEPMTLRAEKQPLYAIAAEVSGDKLLVASRFRAASQERPRNYIRLTQNVPGTDGGRGEYNVSFPLRLRRRMVPTPLSALASRIPSLDLISSTLRRPVGDPFAAEVSSDKWIVVQPLEPTEEEVKEKQEEAELGDFPVSLPRATASVVTVIRGSETHSTEIADLLPYWRAGDDSGPTSPSKGLSVAATEAGHIWLGVPGWDAQTAGGLWLSEDNGRSWKRIEGFSSVSSVAVREKLGRLESVVVAESHFERWNGSFLEPYSTRVVEQRARESGWRRASMPPYGSRSEVEICGTLDGSEIVRVDETVYSQRNVALWRFLLRRAGVSS